MAVDDPKSKRAARPESAIGISGDVARFTFSSSIADNARPVRIVRSLQTQISLHPAACQEKSVPGRGLRAEKRFESVGLLVEIRSLEHRRGVAAEFCPFRPAKNQVQIGARKPLAHLFQETQGIAESVSSRRGLSLCFQRLTADVTGLEQEIA